MLIDYTGSSARKECFFSRSQTPIINYGSGWKTRQVEEPIIFHDPADASQLIMFFSAVDGSGVAHIGRATAALSDPTTWTEYASNPIKSDGNYRLDSVVYTAAKYYFYMTNNADDTIDLYESSDGFTLSFVATVLTATGQGRNDGTSVMQGAVLLDDDGVWRMFYSYRNGATVLPGVRMATSPDGVTFTKAGTGDVFSIGPSGAIDDTYIEWHSIQKIGSKYLMAYEGYGVETWSCQFASADNPLGPWKKSDVVFCPSFHGSLFDKYHTATPLLIELGGVWYLYYQGGGQTGPYISNNWAMGVAVMQVPISRVL